MKGRPKGSPNKKTSARRAVMRRAVAIAMEAKYNEEYDIWISQPRRTVKSIAWELRNKDPDKYSDITERQLGRDIERAERNAWGATRRKK